MNWGINMAFKKLKKLTNHNSIFKVLAGIGLFSATFGNLKN